MITDPDQVVADVLAAAGLGFAVPPAAGANLYLGPLRPPGAGVPMKAAGVLASGGMRNVRLLGSAGKKHRRYSVAIHLRTDVDDLAGGQTLARSVLEALDHRTTGLPAGYVALRAEQPFPIYAGQDETGAHHFTVNVDAELVAA